ncbi:MAG: PEP-CTERM sorting domain-containing protein [bacterium]
MKRSILHVVIALSLPAAVHAQNGQVVGPNGVVVAGAAGNWTPDIQAGAFGQVTTTNGRCGFGGYCAGSLELSVTGNQRASDGQYPDWAFYSLAANPSGFGSLSSLNALSFDWYRQSDPTWNTTYAAIDWPYKTPVLRLTVQDNAGRLSDLIWEGWYNHGAGEELNGSPTPVDQWITSDDLQGGNFWVNLLPRSPGEENMFLDANCNYQPFTFWNGGVPGFTIDQLSGAGGCLDGANSQIMRVAVGVGSQWPLPYHGFVDNVQMGFEGSQELALNTNFDVTSTTTPEPATLALVGTGLLVVFGGASRGRRRG